MTKSNFIECPLDDKDFPNRASFNAHIDKAHAKVGSSGVRKVPKAGDIRAARRTILRGRSKQRRENWAAEMEAELEGSDVL